MNTRPLRARARNGLKNVAKAILAPFNLTITRIDPDPGCALEWIAESQAKGMAVNDFIERDHRKPALSELEQLVFPRVSTHSTVCELGPGTGVYTRYINDYITDGEFHVVDSDPNAIAFLREHLPANPRTHLHLSSGTGLPFGPEVKFDLAFGASIFTGGNLSYFFRYAQEFSRALRPHGYLVFDYFDISTDAGWEVLTKNMARKQPIFAYTYHSTEAVNKVLDMLGFRIVDRQLSVRGSVFVTAQKL